MKSSATKPGRRTPRTHALVMFKMLADFFESDEMAIDFMRRFGGMPLNMPAVEHAEDIARDRQIHRALVKDPRTETVRRLNGIGAGDTRGISKVFMRANNGVGLKEFRESHAKMSSGSSPA